MPYICPHCSFENLDPSIFCVHCGKKLATSGTTGNASTIPPAPAAPLEEDWEKTLSSVSQQPFSAPPTPSTPYWGAPPPAQTAAPEAPSGVSNWGAAPSLPEAQAAPPVQQWAAPPPPHPGYSAGPMQQPGQQWAAPPRPSPSQMSSTTLASLRHAFAGYGSLITHHSWLLEGKKEQGEALASSIKEKLKQQRYGGSAIKVEKLSESTTTQEEREFLVAQKGSIAEFIYVAPAEDSLYLSRATVVQPSLSYVRVGLVALLLFIVVLGPFITLGILHGILSSAQTGLSGTDIVALLGTLQQATFYAIGFSFLYSVALFLLFWLLIISIIAWLRNKDFLQYIRTNRLSDFQMDDVTMLEQATDRVIRNVVDQAGLDAIHIVPPTQGYHPRRKIRFI